MSGRAVAVRWSAVPSRARERDLAVLDPEGRRRAATIVHGAVRARHVTAWALLRRLLSTLHGVAPDAVPLTSRADGRPVTEGPTSVSIAHTRDLIVVAACLDGRIGVDVERGDRWPLPAPAAWCTSAELATLRGLPPGAHHRWLVRRWTVKEATYKAGLADAPAVRWLDPTGEHVVAVVT